jgi:hypothetical protein
VAAVAATTADVSSSSDHRHRNLQADFRAKDEMRRLLAKHPDGIDGFKEDGATATITIPQPQSAGSGDLLGKLVLWHSKHLY